MEMCQINIILTFSINKNIGAHFLRSNLSQCGFFSSQRNLRSKQANQKIWLT